MTLHMIIFFIVIVTFTSMALVWWVLRDWQTGNGFRYKAFLRAGGKEWVLCECSSVAYIVHLLVLVDTRNAYIAQHRIPRRYY